MKIFPGAFLILPLFLITNSCTEKAAEQPAAQAATLQVEGYKAIPSPFNSEVTATGELLPKEQVSVMAPMSGQVLEIFFEEGRPIKQGQPILRIDDRSWKAQMAGLEVELEVAKKDHERKQTLLPLEGSTQEEIDNAYSAIEMLKAQILQLQINIDLANITAPFSGQLGMRNFSKGAFLREGDIITTLTDISQLKLDFSVPQRYKSSISVGKKVLVSIENDTLQATVYAINPLIDVQSRRLNVRALLNQPPGKTIMPGAFAEALITTDFIENALLVPTQAVVPSINEQTVYVYKSGKAVKKVIEMGNRTADKVHVLSGIETGDTLITTGLLYVKDGMPVDLQTIK